jgi:hypothetical protein
MSIGPEVQKFKNPAASAAAAAAAAAKLTLQNLSNSHPTPK